MRSFIPIDLTFADKQGSAHSLRLWVLPDYLTIGTLSDRLRVPLWPLTAQRIADAWNCVMPTTKMVTLLWHSTPNKLPPQPWGPPYDASMMSTDRIVKHNARIEQSIASRGIDCSKLTVGHKKDIVLTNKLVIKPKQVAIFGWHMLNGKPIQPLYLGHENTYSDYSHSVRLISRICLLDDQQDDLVRLLRDPNLYTALSDEGPLQLVRQPLT